MGPHLPPYLDCVCNSDGVFGQKMICRAALVEPPFSAFDFFVKKSNLVREAEKEVGMACSRREDVEKLWESDTSHEEVERIVDHLEECEECMSLWRVRRDLEDIPAGVWEVAGDTLVMRQEKLGRIRRRRVFRGLVWLMIGVIAVGAVCVISLIKF